MNQIVVLERDGYGHPLVAAATVRTTFFGKRTVYVDGRGPFDKNDVFYFSQPVYGLHKWNLQGASRWFLLRCSFVYDTILCHTELEATTQRFELRHNMHFNADTFAGVANYVRFSARFQMERGVCTVASGHLRCISLYDDLHIQIKRACGGDWEVTFMVP
jgi:hypothetical protein